MIIFNYHKHDAQILKTTLHSLNGHGICCFSCIKSLSDFETTTLLRTEAKMNSSICFGKQPISIWYLLEQKSGSGIGTALN